MPNRVPWEPDFAVGHALVDAQHRGLLAQCNLLADLCLAGDGEDSRRGFDQAFEQLKVLARQHCETESSLLARGDFPDLEDHRIEFEEFEYLAGEIATTGNFDRLELQRFLAVWCLGHIRGTVDAQRAYLAGGQAATPRT